LLYAGQIPSWDVSGVRPAGAVLKTFGGRASGPDPLVELFDFSVNLFKNAAGRKLTSIECHDLCCKIASIVVVGGVRRSALISLSNLTDDRVRRAKHGQWWVAEPQRALANNSACYTEKPDFEAFLNEWTSLYESRSGERGLFSRPAAKNIVEASGRRDPDYDFGTNPCSEIILRPNQFCNLSEVVVRADDTLEDLKRKVQQAAILGTLQSTLTDFKYLRKVWTTNTEEERLLGVSLTGIMDHSILSDPDSKELPAMLEELKQVAIDTNKAWAKKLGIPASTAITCVKPSGTVSQLVDSASGIHARYSEYYIRRVRADVKDPLALLMQDAGVPCEPDTHNSNVLVFSFPKKSPEGATVVNNVTAMDQLKLWMIYQNHWCEHKPSCTVYYKDSEFLEVGSWVYNNFDVISGVSFLPFDGGTYQQAPYERITEGQYTELLAEMPEIPTELLPEYEKIDTTTSSQELACSGATGCEL
jgi:ribonucleoside-diphosphate reductase alpha chain